MCRLRHNPHRVWPVDVGPTRDVASRVHVSIEGMPTRTAAKHRLTWPVGFSGVAAFGTLAAGVARVNKNHLDTREFGFVQHLVNQVGKCPAMQGSPLRPFSPYPRAYPFEVFKGYHPLRAFGVIYQGFAEAVVHVVLKTAFPAGKFFEFALRRLRALLLQFGTKSAVTVTNAFDVRPAFAVAIGSGGKLRDAEVNPQHLFNILRSRLRYVAGGEKVELAVYQHEVAFPLLGTE